MEQLNSTVLLMLGSNSLDASVAMQTALTQIDSKLKVKRIGSIWKSEAWGFDGPEFLNQIVEVFWQEPMDKLLQLLLNIEKDLGRIRLKEQKRYENRRMDIDILMWSSGRYNSECLEVPHPRMHLRRFVLVPLVEFWGDWLHPVQKLSINELLMACHDEKLVHLFQTTEN